MKNDGIWLLLDSRGRGGIETHVSVLNRVLRRDGLDSRIVLLNDYGPHPLFDSANADGALHLQGTADLFTAVRNRRPALIHTHGYKAGIVGRLASSVLGVPVVSTFHSGDRGRGRVAFYSWLDAKTAFLGPAIAVSKDIASNLPVDASVIDNFVEIPGMIHRAPVDRPFTVGFVGRLSEEKGADLFCQIAARLDGCNAIVFGDGPQRAELESAFGDRVRFAGMVGDMASHWHEMDVLCMPSRREGLPLAALEAMSNGLPVAAFAVGGLPDLIASGHNGWIVPTQDVDTMVRLLDGLAKAPTSRIRDKGYRARETVCRRYSPETAIPRILAQYCKAGWLSDGRLSHVAA
jgi:glycosyltransferase involved in cell wall biosynthesis